MTLTCATIDSSVLLFDTIQYDGRGCWVSALASAWLCTAHNSLVDVMRGREQQGWGLQGSNQDLSPTPHLNPMFICQQEACRGA
jgi:hypothetical protein